MSRDRSDEVTWSLFLLPVAFSHIGKTAGILLSTYFVSYSPLNTLTQGTGVLKIAETVGRG